MPTWNCLSSIYIQFLFSLSNSQSVSNYVSPIPLRKIDYVQREICHKLNSETPLEQAFQALHEFRENYNTSTF